MADIVTVGMQLDATGMVTGARKAEDALKGVDKAAGKTEGSLDQLKKAAGALGLAFGAYQAVQLAKEVLTLGARYETLGVVVDRMGQNVNKSAAYMRDLEKSLESTGISMIQARNNIARMIQAQIDLTVGTDLARIAQNAAVIANLNSSAAFEKLTYAIQSGQPRLLRTMGIMVNFQKGYSDTARAMGVATEALTEQEKVQSRVNTVMEASIQIQGVYEAAMGTAGKQILSSQRYLENLKVKVSEAFQPSYTTAVFAYSNALKFLGNHATELAWTLRVLFALLAGKSVSIAIGWLLKYNATLITTTGIMARATIVARGMWAAMGGWIGLAVVGIISLATAWSEAMGKIAEAEDVAAEAAKRAAASHVEALDTRTVALLEFQKAQLEGLANQIQSTLISVPTTGKDDPRLAQLQEMRAEIVRITTAIENKNTIEAEGDADAAAALAEAMRAMDLELRKVTALNEAFGQSAHALALVKLEHEELAAISKIRADTEHPENIEALAAETKAIFEQKRAALELTEAERKMAIQRQFLVEIMNEAAQVAATYHSLTEQYAAQIRQYAAELKGGAEAVRKLRIEEEKLAVMKQFAGDPEMTNRLLQQIDTREALIDALEAQRIKQEMLNNAEGNADEMGQAYIQALRNIQDLFGQVFQDIFDGTEDGFENLADSILSIFKGLAAQIAGLRLEEMFDIEGAIDNILAGGSLTGKEKALKYGTGAVVGFGAGQQGGAMSGMLSGGLSGAAMGGPPGAALGAAAGLLGSLFQGDDTERELAKERNDILRQNQATLMDIRSGLSGVAGPTGEDYTNAANAALAMSKMNMFGGEGGTSTLLGSFLGGEQRESGRGAGQSAQFQAILAQWDMTLTEFNRLAEESGIKLLDSSGRVIQSALEDLSEALMASWLLWKQQEKAIQDGFQVRRLMAAGDKEGAEILRQQIANQKEINDLIAAGFPHLVEELEALQVAEAGARALEKMRKELEKFRDFSADLGARKARLAGDEVGAVTLELAYARAQELEAARKLVEEGIITQEMFDDLASVLDEEMADAIKAVEDAIAAAVLSFNNSLQSLQMENAGDVFGLEMLGIDTWAAEQIKWAKDLFDDDVIDLATLNIWTAAINENAQAQKDAYEAGRAQQAKDFKTDVEIMEQENLGTDAGDLEAYRLGLYADADARIANAKALYDAGIVTEEWFNRFTNAIWDGVNIAMEDFTEQVLKTAEALREAEAAEAAREAMSISSLHVRMLRAQGRDADAQALADANAIQQAINVGRSAEYVALLRATLAEEARARAANAATKAVEATTKAVEEAARVLNAPSGLRLSLLQWRASAFNGFVMPSMDTNQKGQAVFNFGKEAIVIQAAAGESGDSLLTRVLGAANTRARAGAGNAFTTLSEDV